MLMSPPKKLYLLFFIMLLFLTDANAQLVNIEKERKEKKEGFQGAAAVSIALTQNTTQIFQAGNQINLQYHNAPHTILFLNNIGLMSVDGDNLINNGFQHLRYNFEYLPQLLTLEAFTQHQYNTVRLLGKRFLLGTGPRFTMLETETSGFYLAPLVMYEYEQLNDDFNTITRKFKGNIYVSAAVGN
jgi:hypothetical protein